MDDEFVTSVREAAVRGAAEVAATTAADTDGLAHRELMRRAKVLGSVALAAPESAPVDVFGRTAALVERLAALQTASGLFEGGDNVQSPPDSAFTINDVCDVHHLLGAAPAEAAGLRERLAEILIRATPALLAGGVHTPNHRWELTAALARIHRSFPDRRLVDRAEEWLAEGIDIDGDGFFSERSPNYATAVSIPSLLAVADILDRPELRADVERNLELTLSLIGQDGAVETLPSRRQDQGTHFPLARYVAAFREFAVNTGRGDFAWAAGRAASDGIDDQGLLAELLLRPAIGGELPAALAPRRDELVVHASASLAVRRGDRSELVLFGGSDYPRHRRIRSGLAVDPTFLRVFAGAAILDSARLSRSFFGLGPFRADGLHRQEDGGIALRERLVGGYYEPLPIEARRPDGGYDLVDEGRFSASMSFGERSVDEVVLATSVVAHPRADGVDLEVELSGPPLAWSLELAFRPGGVLDAPGPRPSDGAYVLIGRTASYRAGGDAIVIEVEGLTPVDNPIGYVPGEDYTYLGGTDAAPGVRLLIGGQAPARFRLRLRTERDATSGAAA
ncbi:hypothetical protein [Leifsonia poae]|uniref:Uncharacterized protein n=1 Tax=Leifsonia poae TaxID=110933 RepID=A0A9W6LYA8_9MICO|nr:hypothetical protein [Leifsonia poae]GLJ74655.1 hypothetical protein GCM10017584_02280 [Leifsonia poae]